MNTAFDFSLPAGVTPIFWGMVAAVFAAVFLWLLWGWLKGVALFRLSAGQTRPWKGFIPVLREKQLGDLAFGKGEWLAVISAIRLIAGAGTLIKAAQSVTRVVASADRLLTDGKPLTEAIYDPLYGMIPWMIAFAVIWVIYHVLTVVAVGKILKQLVPERAPVAIVISLLFPFAKTLFLLSARKVERLETAPFMFEDQ